MLKQKVSRPPRVVAFIQARLGSHRLPGKVLMDIHGQPMLARVVGRLRQCPLLTDLIVATTREHQDDPIVQFCLERTISYYRGSQHDVLDRFYQAALIYQADVIVRITADCPLIDPCITEKVIESYLKNSSEAVGATNAVKRTYPRGLDTEVLSFKALEKAWQMSVHPYQREHVTSFIYEHPELFKMIDVMQQEDLSHWRWTVDEGDDLRFVREIYQMMKASGKDPFGFHDVVALIKEHPEVTTINSQIKQKTVY